MKKRLSFKESLFILPAIIIIAIFSLWPVVQSLTYTLFDYQLNNQQKSGLYLSEQFNVNLFKETELYVAMFLEDDLENVTDTEDQAKVQDLIQELESTGEQYREESGVIQISSEQMDELQELYTKSTAVIQDLNAKYELIHAQNLPALVEDIQNSLVPSNFIGLEAYQKALADKRIWAALVNTLIFTFSSVSIELVLGLGLALVLNKAMRGQGLIRTTSLIPWAIPTAVAAMMWGYLYDGTSGVVAHFFENIGLVSQSQNLLLTGAGAMFSAILADVWKTTPYMALLLLAGLQNISNNLYEAASIDGANKVQSFFRVTLPLLKPAILVALLFRTLDAFRVFDLIYVLTGGGPGGSTETLSIYAYKIMFGATNFGYGSVVVVIMFVCVALIATLFVRLLGTNLMDRS
ncbi:carbohydrate ABC transporter permease [Bacillus horti]|uniref:Multiple sugar transport system permease protein n=1 Tax=Caldalkalibacillus horti TaxID=77523 RepID=A0ABT9VVD6_9BACI|nr:sugar ABC transporter permease [Bacillus horti]MDQ0164952.1 multiple sugar transport system permease protein [Bacillus horti]